MNLAVVELVQERYGHAAADVIATIVAHEAVHGLAVAGDASDHEESRARAAALSVGGRAIVTHIDLVLEGVWS